MIKRIKQIAIAGVLLLASIGIVGCLDVSNTEPGTGNIDYYTYDPRTNLCFAWGANAYGDTVANVPCTVEVLTLAGKLTLERPPAPTPVPNPNA